MASTHLGNNIFYYHVPDSSMVLMLGKLHTYVLGQAMDVYVDNFLYFGNDFRLFSS